MTASHCNTTTSDSATTPRAVGEAVGVSEKRWYVALVNNNNELKCQENLFKGGFEAYVAYQRTPVVWRNGRKSWINRVLLPGMVMVKCTEKERRAIVNLSFINRFMINRAAKRDGMLTSPLAVISQKEIDTLRFMLGQSDIPVHLTQERYTPKDKAEVVRGPLKGLVCEVVSADGDGSEVFVALDILGAAHMKIQTVNLKKIQ